MRSAAGLSRSVRCGGVAPASGTSRSSSTERPARTTSRTSVVAGRASTAPTASAAGEPAGPPTLPNAGPAGPSFPAAATVSVSSRWAPSTARASGLSLNAGERLDERDERDPGGIMGIAVPVRVDRALEAREQLVGARVDRVVPALVGLPAGDADREDGRAGRDPAGDRSGPDQQPGHLGSVTLELGRIGGLRARPGIHRVADDVDPVEHVPVQVRLAEVHAGVEQRNRHAVAVDARERMPGAAGAGAPLVRTAAG